MLFYRGVFNIALDWKAFYGELVLALIDTIEIAVNKVSWKVHGYILVGSVENCSAREIRALVEEVEGYAIFDLMFEDPPGALVDEKNFDYFFVGLTDIDINREFGPVHYDLLLKSLDPQIVALESLYGPKA